MVVGKNKANLMYKVIATYTLKNKKTLFSREVHDRFLFILLLELKSSPQCSETLHAQLFSFTYMNTYLHAMYCSIQTAACQLQWFGLICNASFHLLYTYICGACYRNSRKSWWQRYKRCSTGCPQRFHS